METTATTRKRTRKTAKPQRGKKLKVKYLTKYKELVDDPFSLRIGAQPSYL